MPSLPARGRPRRPDQRHGPDLALRLSPQLGRRPWWQLPRSEKLLALLYHLGASPEHLTRLASRFATPD